MTVGGMQERSKKILGVVLRILLLGILIGAVVIIQVVGLTGPSVIMVMFLAVMLTIGLAWVITKL